MKTKVYLQGILLLLLLQKPAIAQHPQLMLPVGHTFEVSDTRFSPDSKTIVTGSLDNTAKLWDVQSGRLLHNLEGHTDIVFTVTYSPDGKNILTASFDNTAKIWDVQSGKLLHSLEGNSSDINNATYSPDGKYIVTFSEDDTVKIWDAQSGNLLHSLEGHSEDVFNSIFSPDSKNIVTASGKDNTAKIRDLQTGKLLNSLEGIKYTALDFFEKEYRPTVTDAGYSPDGKNIITLSDDNAVIIWDAQNGRLLYSLKGHTDWVYSACYSPDSKYIVTASGDSTLKIWDAQSGSLLHSLEGHTDKVKSVSYSPDGKNILSASDDHTTRIWDAQSGRLLQSLGVSNLLAPIARFSQDGMSIITSSENTVIIWDAQSGKLIQSLEGHTKTVHSSTYSPDYNKVITISGDYIAKIWDVQIGKLLYNLTAYDWVTVANFSPDGKKIVTGTGYWDTNTAKIWDAQTGKLLDSLKGIENEQPVTSIRYSPDGKNIMTITDDGYVRIWDAQSGELLQSLEGQFENANVFNSARFSPDGKNIVTSSDDNNAKIWDTQNCKLVRSLEGHSSGVNSASYSPDGKFIVTASADKTANIWVAKNGKLHATLEGHTGRVVYASYNPDGKYIITVSDDNTAIIWHAPSISLIKTIAFKGRFHDIDWVNRKIITDDNSRFSLLDFVTGSELLSWIEVDSNDWVVTHPSGLFDASPGAMDKLYFVSGLDIIDLNQLKARYYEPGLWKKVMSGEKLRDVVGFNNLELPPDIRLGQIDNKGILPVEVINRGGGIGEVTLYINGKEVIKDLRQPGTETRSPSLSFSIPVSAFKSLVPGAKNYLAVKAWNAGQWIESRSTVVEYSPPSKSGIKPAIYIIVCGISDYTGDKLDLKFAALDAESMAKGLELGAKRLFGIDKSYLYILSTNQNQKSFPTKVNILNTFEKVAGTASSSDVFVVYLSGHGMNLGGADGDFYYLTQEAYTANTSDYNDPAIKQQTTLSSQELVELFKKVAALKQVLIIDACASGKVVDNLIAKRDIESSTLRALDRMKDRTGMYIITGCTADAVSYEASRYGQGVLTYSLLEGLRGQALREDKFVDVNQLFQFAQERVPVLASGIGGIQSPQVFSPYGSQSFDIGELSTEEKGLIPIAKARTIYIRSNFLDEQKLRDVLGLGKKMDDMLNEVSVKGESSPLLFVDVSEYPDGCQLSGLYKQLQDKITLRLNMVCEGKETSYNLEAKDEKELLEKIMTILSK